MIAAIHQPVYLPWLGFFDKMRRSDVFVILDDVAFSRNSIENRNLIKTPRGRLWLTVPVRTKGRFGQFIKDVEIDASQKWAEKHWKSISMNYNRAEFFAAHAPFFERVYSSQWTRLIDLNMKLIEYIAEALSVKRDTVLSSTLGARGTGTSRLVDICEKLGAATYVAGAGARSYQDDSLFKSRGIKPVHQMYFAKPYPQLYGSFLPNLSAIDYLFNQDGADPFRSE